MVACALVLLEHGRPSKGDERRLEREAVVENRVRCGAEVWAKGRDLVDRGLAEGQLRCLSEPDGHLLG